jgi:hypothetical protein
MNPPPQPDRTQPPADAGLGRLHMGKYEHAGIVHERFGHVEQARQQPDG